jgi:hypothetical protein
MGRWFIYVFVGTFVAATNLEGMCGVLQIDGCHEAREIAAMHANIASRRFPPRWTVEDIGAFFS